MTRLTIDELEVLTPDQLGKLLIAAVRKDPPDVQYIQDLLLVGCPIDARDRLGFTVLHRAAWDGHLELVEFLISQGVDINAKATAGSTAWDFASNEIKKACPKLKSKYSSIPHSMLF